MQIILAYYLIMKGEYTVIANDLFRIITAAICFRLLKHVGHCCVCGNDVPKL